MSERYVPSDLVEDFEIEYEGDIPDVDSENFINDNELSDHELHDRYDEFLEEIYGETVNVAGTEMSTVNVLKEMDETAYQCGFNDWLDSEVQNGSLIEF